MARQFAITPIIGAKWSIEGPDASDAIVEASGNLVTELKDDYLTHIISCCYDFGWGAAELWYDTDYQVHFKPLANDLTQVQIDETGEFSGLYQPLTMVEIPKEYSCYVSMYAEPGKYYGVGYMETARKAYGYWLSAAAGSDRYSTKIAGSHWVIYYPNGEYVDSSGNTQDNSVLADEILTSLESSGAVALPQPVARYVEDLNKVSDIPSWKVELLSDTGPRNASFNETLRYLDTQFCRAFGLPERSVLEGQYGTKAESESQKDYALTSMDYLSNFFAKEFQKQILVPYLALYFGEDQAKQVEVCPSAIDPEALIYARTVATQVLSPQMVDVDSLLDQVGIPKADNIAQVQNEPVQEIKNVNE